MYDTSENPPDIVVLFVSDGATFSVGGSVVAPHLSVLPSEGSGLLNAINSFQTGSDIPFHSGGFGFNSAPPVPLGLFGMKLKSQFLS